MTLILVCLSHVFIGRDGIISFIHSHLFFDWIEPMHEIYCDFMNSCLEKQIIFRLRMKIHSAQLKCEMQLPGKVARKRNGLCPIRIVFLIARIECFLNQPLLLLRFIFKKSISRLWRTITRQLNYRYLKIKQCQLRRRQRIEVVWVLQSTATLIEQLKRESVIFTVNLIWTLSTWPNDKQQHWCIPEEIPVVERRK